MAQQSIFPDRKLFFTGETVRIRLAGVTSGVPGRAVVRTNLGRAAIRRRELLEKGELGRTPRGGDWHDILLNAADGGFEVTLPLTEPGVFEAKCCFIPDDGGPILWAAGNNFKIKVNPAESVTGNAVYCAFVRQFGTWMDRSHSPTPSAALSQLDAEKFTVIPPSGTFRRLIAQLDHIFGTLHCRILQLLPIHPVPTSYGRMGLYGSPFAVTDYFAVDLALAEFDPAATPMEQFIELVDAVHARRGRVFMDIPVNHTGWASKLQCEHPDYFKRSPDGKFLNPGAWGVVWADLCQLDYRRNEVRNLMAKVFMFWCRCGVDGFRCDAGYMVPADAWQYIVAKVRDEFPDTVFLLEGLGGPPKVQEELLGKIGLDWGYSELFQNYSRDEISAYFPYFEQLNSDCGIMVNFAETHDNDRLAARGHAFARLRFLVNALLCHNGAFGFANGAEFFASEKIDVHGCGALNFHAPENLCALIGRINRILGAHPAFGPGVGVELIQHGGGNVIAARRHGNDIPELLVLLNLDCEHAAEVKFRSRRAADSATDLISGRKVEIFRDGDFQRVPLGPAEGLCLSFDDFTVPEDTAAMPSAVLDAQTRSMAQRAALHLRPMTAAAEADGEAMRRSPEDFVAGLTGMNPPPVTTWRCPVDTRREVMLPPGDLLLVRSAGPFRINLSLGKKTLARMSSLPLADGSGEFALIALPDNPEDRPRELSLCIADFSGTKPVRERGRIRQLARPERRLVRLAGRYSDAAEHYVFGSNDRGGYAMFSAQWGRITGKYDAILAANLRPDCPVDRHVMFTCCRAWLVIDDYSQELTAATLEEYCAHPGNRARWQFVLPDGHGGNLTVTVEFRMALNDDAVELRFRREGDRNDRTAPARLILRPDVEDRINHTVIRACDGAEHHYRDAITPLKDGFEFNPGGRMLRMRLPGGTFTRAPEWRYMTDLPQERYYGMADKNDLFSPGYFTIALRPDEEAVLTARAGDAAAPRFPERTFPEQAAPAALADDALRRFVVRRDDLSTVIAGYPWFLDWGRDTLIVLRGLCRYPEFHAQCAAIIRKFAAFERNGTIPNMICGDNDSNRDTVDAPLWLIVAARDYIAASGDRDFPAVDCGGRTLRDVMRSIVDHYRSGTPNGIRMDAASGLIFSPSHFTWMDTNFPAGTPREGYPVEIQALWFAALEFLGETKSAEQVRRSIIRYFFHDGTVADCLHGEPGTPAARAVADDHLRSNLLTLITMGAVTEPEACAKILNLVEKLLVPGAMRTLDDAEVNFPLPIVFHGAALNDPRHPYQGHYRGPEDTSRKPAYHNGTAWCWQFPAYCEALCLIGGAAAKPRAKALLYACVDHLENGVIGEMPEVLDGDAPHRSGGCLAQAWSISEFFRVLKIVEE